MTQSAANLAQSKSKGQAIFEYILLTVSLCVLALRVTYSSGIDLSINGWTPDSADILFNTAVSTLLICILRLVAYMDVLFQKDFVSSHRH